MKKTNLILLTNLSSISGLCEIRFIKQICPQSQVYARSVLLTNLSLLSDYCNIYEFVLNLFINKLVLWTAFYTNNLKKIKANKQTYSRVYSKYFTKIPVLKVEFI